MSDSKLPNSSETPTPVIYTISGMGMNEKLFRRLKLPFSSRHIPWIEPFKGETLRDYSVRIAKDIPKDQPVVLIGLSFGGVVALEIANWLKPQKVVLISTIKLRSERPLFFRLMEYVPLYLFQNKKLQDATISIWGPFFGINNQADIRKVMGMFCDLSPDYYRWSVGQMVKLRRKRWEVDILHIHGSKDKVFPSRHIRDAYIVKGGGHAMIINKHAEISEQISQFLYREPARG